MSSQPSAYVFFPRVRRINLARLEKRALVSTLCADTPPGLDTYGCDTSRGTRPELFSTRLGLIIDASLRLRAFHHELRSSPGILSADSVASNVRSLAVSRAPGWPSEPGQRRTRAVCNQQGALCLMLSWFPRDWTGQSKKKKKGPFPPQELWTFPRHFGIFGPTPPRLCLTWSGRNSPTGFQRLSTTTLAIAWQLHILTFVVSVGSV